MPGRHDPAVRPWPTAGIVVFGLSSLRYPRYFELVLIPMYCLLCTEACRYVRTHPRALPAAAAAGLVIAVAGLSTFYMCVLSRNDNVLYQTQQYAQSHIPAGSVVLTEEEIGDQIQQQWCSIARAGICGRAATYAITYTSYLQPAAPVGDNAFYALMKGATRVQTFQGFKETVIVWRLRGNALH